MPARLLTPEEMRAFRAWRPPTPTPQAIPPAPAPAAPPTAQPPARPAARQPIYLDAMTPDELAGFYAEFGYELGERPAPNTMQRPWNNPDPLARRERLRKAEMNRIAIAQMRREKAAVESARIAKLEAGRMTREATLKASSDELRANADKQGVGGYGGLYEGIDIREPGSFALPAVRPSITFRDQQEAARRLRRQEANQPPPQLGSDAYTQELAAAGVSDVVVAAAPQPQPTTAAAPQPHVTKASRLSPAAFGELLAKKFGFR